MEELANLEWVPVLVSTVLAFGLGYLWYSDNFFGEKWRVGKGGEVEEYPMWMPMTAQLFGTLLLAVIVNMAAADGHVGHAVIVGLTIIGFIKANGIYSGKSKYAIGVEAGYIVAMVIIMVVVNMFM